MRPVRLTMPLRANTAVPGLPSRAERLEPVGAQADDAGRVGVALDVVDVGGLAPEAGDRRVGRAGPRLAALALDGGHQRGLFAADERARAFFDLDIEGEVRAEDAIAEQAELARLPERELQAADRQRVLGAAVDVAHLRADGVAGEDHALDQGMGVALERRTVHERAGVALVRVADDVLGPALRLPGQLPLRAGGEAAAAAAAQPGANQLVDHALGGHLAERLLETAVAVHREVVVERLGVDEAAVGEDDAELLLLEGDAVVLLGVDEGEGVEQVARMHRCIRNHLTNYDGVRQGRSVIVGCKDFGDVVGRGLAVVHAAPVVGLQLDHRLVGAHADTADAADLGVKAAAGGFLPDRLHGLVRAGGEAARAHADGDVQVGTDGAVLPALPGGRAAGG